MPYAGRSTDTSTKSALASISLDVKPSNPFDLASVFRRRLAKPV